MLKCALRLKVVLVHLIQFDDAFTQFNIMDSDWKACEEMVKFLEPFDEITHEMSSSCYPTINLVIPNIHILKQHIAESVSSF